MEENSHDKSFDIAQNQSDYSIDLAYLNLLNGNISTTAAGAHLQFTYGPTGGFVITPINGATTALTTVSAYDAIMCSQLSAATYGANAIAIGNQVVFVQISSTEYTKIQLQYAVGSATISLIWQIYSIS